jgi:hypothetical protein
MQNAARQRSRVTVTLIFMVILSPSRPTEIPGLIPDFCLIGMGVSGGGIWLFLTGSNVEPTTVRRRN